MTELWLPCSVKSENDIEADKSIISGGELFVTKDGSVGGTPASCEKFLLVVLQLDF